MTQLAQRQRLLIIEDDEVDRRRYIKLLHKQDLFDCEVLLAAEGAAGLALLRSEAPDCVLLDYSLPDMTGLEFLAAAAQDGELPCAMVLVTGHGNEMIAVEAMKRGVRDYLVKDQVSETKLLQAVTGAVAQRALHQRLSHSLTALKTSHEKLEAEVATRKLAEQELRLAKEAAEEASKAKSRFVAMVSHELRTPLHCMLGSAELLILEGPLSEAQTHRVDALKQAGTHLLGLIEQVLDFASIEAGKLQVRPEEFAVGPLIDGCVTVMTPIAVERGLDLHVLRAAAAPARIFADPSRVRQILLNLLGNALKYTDAGSVELRLKPGAERGGLRLEVADTGRGIDPASRARLFQSFERLDSTSSIEGTGLGLSIAARIAGLMNGTIGHDANPCGGSIFWLELPQGVAPEIAPAEPHAAPLPAARGQRILVVDDIAMNREVIGAFLRAAGHEALFADCGVPAVRFAAEQNFDLILMDVRMPVMDGLEATRRIRALVAPWNQVPILGVTANAFAEQVTECMEAGMDGHLPKPVSYASLVDAITRFAKAPKALMPA
jgi:signal transduction histidine kinase